MRVLQNDFMLRVKELPSLSEKINQDNNINKLFSMIKLHSNEIEELYKNKNNHWAVETADLVVLCFELLVAEGRDIDDVFGECLPRFYKKLNELENQT
jgi:hypothetical protein